MNNNIKHSFSETSNKLAESFNNTISIASGISESMVTNNDIVTKDIFERNPITHEVKKRTVSIPTLFAIRKQLNVLQNNFEAITSGSGTIVDKNGVRIELSKELIPKSPNVITNVDVPTKFVTTPNWFFEDLLFPALKIQIDLKGKIDDSSDRVYCKRVIIDNKSQMDVDWFKANILPYDMTYNELIKLLNENSKIYWEDEDICNLPLKSNKYEGKFFISNTEHVSDDIVFYLDTLHYGKTGYDVPVQTELLKIGDKLSIGNSIFEVVSVDINKTSVTLDRVLGDDIPVVGSYIFFFNEPFSEKIVEIGISNDELNVLFLKGINEKFNILSDNWSSSIPYYTNDLYLSDKNISLADYYQRYVVDYGNLLESQAKERFVPAFIGETPNAPKLKSTDFRVVSINTQLNSTLSNDSIENSYKQSISLKTEIDSINNSIATEKQELINQTDDAARKRVHSNISELTDRFNKLSTEYSSLIRSIYAKTLDTNGNGYTPKYRLRGFFPIPELLPASAPDDLKQDIIQFELMYRYIRVDNTGTNLNTFKYKDETTGVEVTGVYSDWNVSFSKVKERVWDPQMGVYKWYNENISDGSAININQIDIPIQKGEKVELKVRSISEAGYPSNPLKSTWSNSIVLDFPNNIETSNSINDIYEDAKNETFKIELNGILNTAGINEHISDSIPNPKKGNGVMYRHTGDNISVDVKTPNQSGTVTITTLDLQSFVDKLTDNIFFKVDVNGTQKSISLSDAITELYKNKQQ